MRLFFYARIITFFVQILQMALPLFFLADDVHNDQVILNEDTSRHVVQVLRMQVGSLVQLTDGKGHLLDAEILEGHKKRTLVKINKVQTVTGTIKRITIAISPLKNASRFEWFLEKATEIGVNEIIPLICQRTEKETLRISRLQQILVSAMLQSRQVWLPGLHEPTLFSQVMQNDLYEKKYIAHCDEGIKRNLVDENISNLNSVLMLIGPEGDFTSGEIDQALVKGFTPVSMGENRLRTETAGVVAATLLKLNK